MNWLNYNHDRKENISKTVLDFKNYIDSFTERPAFKSWMSHWSKHYDMPQDTISQQVKNILADCYDFKKTKFLPRYSIHKIPKYFLHYYAYLAYVLIFSQKKIPLDQKFDLVIDGIENELEIERFSHLIEKFEKPLVVSPFPIKKDNITIITQAFKKSYDRKEALNVTLKELLFGGFKHLYYSLKCGVNLFPIVCRLIDHYLYYSSVFKIANGKYIIQERHYNISPIRNHLFKKMGGEITSTIQKNIIFSGHTGFYYDFDVFFSLGKKTAERALKQGAKINKIVPVGSKFMEYYCSNKNGQESKASKKYDLVCYGLNLVFFHDCYDGYINDYYDHFRWLTRFADEHPEYNVGIKHHPNNRQDPIENEIIRNSKVDRIEQSINSYALGLEPGTCNVSFGSTIGFEFISERIPFVFIDPGNRNLGFLPEEKSFDQWRATSYEEFEKKVLNILSNSSLEITSEIADNFCLKSNDVSEKIYNYLTN